jgi:hypothetical protein
LKKDANAAQQKSSRSSEVILVTEIAMLFLYLPFIIFEALMLNPPKRNVGELGAAWSGSGLVRDRWRLA